MNDWEINGIATKDSILDVKDFFYNLQEFIQLNGNLLEILPGMFSL